MTQPPSSHEHGHPDWVETLPDPIANVALPKPVVAPQSANRVKEPPPEGSVAQMLLMFFGMFTPAFLLIIFDTQLYFFLDTHTQSLYLAGLLTPLYIYVVFKARTKLNEKYLAPRIEGGLKFLLGIVFAPFLILYSWCLLFFAAALLLPGTTLESKVYPVSEVSTGKYCRPNMELKGWPSLMDAKFCAKDFSPPPKVGEPMVVRGHFSTRAVYVIGVSRLSQVE